MSRNKWILLLSVLGAVLILAGSLALLMWRAEQAARVVSCVANLNNLKSLLRESLGEGGDPPDTDHARRGTELNALLALGPYLRNDPSAFGCREQVHQYGGGAAVESYRMPDWTREQWQRAGHFQLELRHVPSPWQDAYSAPVIWDTEPVHNGARNVLFYHGTIRSRVPEEIFQQLRKASEEFVRDTTTEPQPVTPPE